jgi:hypothetical protein
MLERLSSLQGDSSAARAAAPNVTTMTPAAIAARINMRKSSMALDLVGKTMARH